MAGVEAMNAARWLVASLVAMLAGCGQPVPAEKAAYVGTWTAPNMTLSITQEGRVEYRRVDGNASTSVSGPLQGFKGDDFEVGIGPISTTFVVSSPPKSDGDGFTMTVDGVSLVKVR